MRPATTIGTMLDVYGAGGRPDRVFRGGLSHRNIPHVRLRLVVFVVIATAAVTAWGATTIADNHRREQAGGESGMSDYEALAVVEPVFQRIFDVVWASGAESSEALNSLSDAERAIYATRVIEGQLDNGGWYQVFGNGVDHLIGPAIDGYLLLGLPEYAAVLTEVRAESFGEDSPEELGERLDNAYFALSGSEEARASLVKSRNLS